MQYTKCEQYVRYEKYNKSGCDGAKIIHDFLVLKAHTNLDDTDVSLDATVKSQQFSPVAKQEIDRS